MIFSWMKKPWNVIFRCEFHVRVITKTEIQSIADTW
jgi:hypothetical protein